MDTATQTRTATFTVGQTYYARSAVDSATRFVFSVAKRTARFVTLVRDNGAEGETIRVGIRVDDEGEWTLPFGTYSMAPVLRATCPVIPPRPASLF